MKENSEVTKGSYLSNVADLLLGPLTGPLGCDNASDSNVRVANLYISICKLGEN